MPTALVVTPMGIDGVADPRRTVGQFDLGRHREYEHGHHLVDRPGLALGELGVNLAPLIAGLGIAGVALGFGAQSLVKDCIAGLFMLLEDQYGIGDVVDLDEARGTVEKISLRTTCSAGSTGRSGTSRTASSNGSATMRNCGPLR